jgi:hypothetical protein
MLTNAEFYANYADYDNLIIGMEEKLLDAKKRNPSQDFSEAEKKINTLHRLKDLYHLMYHCQQTIDNESGKVMSERKKLLDKIGALERENLALKENIESKL